MTLNRESTVALLEVSLFLIRLAANTTAKAYSEWKGPVLDDLIEEGLACVTPTDDYPFGEVRLTPAGERAAQKVGALRAVVS